MEFTFYQKDLHVISEKDSMERKQNGNKKVSGPRSVYVITLYTLLTS